MACARRWPAGHPLPEVVDEIARSPAHFGMLAPELNGLGGPWAEELARRFASRPDEAGGALPPPRARVIEEGIPSWSEIQRPRRPRREASGFTTRLLGIHLDARLKSAGYASLRALIEAERIVFPAALTELRSELLGLRVSLTEAGERIEGASDDLADALMLSLRPARFADGRYGTALGLLADPNRPLPAPAVASAQRRGPAVETGGGLSVPREPAWQSVDGREVTLPGAGPPPIYDPGTGLQPAPRAQPKGRHARR